LGRLRPLCYLDAGGQSVNRYVEFRLRGVTFRANPAMPVRHVRRLAKAQRSQRPETYSTVVAAIRATLVEGDRRRWDALLADESIEVPITLQTLMQVADDLVGGPRARPLRR
jgi:hypothetical protein